MSDHHEDPASPSAERVAAHRSRADGYRRLSDTHLDTIARWVADNPMPYTRPKAGVALTQFTMRMYGRALEHRDLEALELAVAADQLGPEWPHERGIVRSTDWACLSFAAWIGTQLDFDWANFISRTLLSLAERSASPNVDVGGVDRNRVEAIERARYLVDGGGFPLRSAGHGRPGEPYVPVWVDGVVEFARRWDDDQHRPRRALEESLYDQSATHPVGDWFPWFADTTPPPSELWTEPSLDPTGMAGLGHRLALGAGDEVLVEALTKAVTDGSDLMGIPLRALRYWDGDVRALARVERVVDRLDLKVGAEVGAEVARWLERPDAFTRLGSSDQAHTETNAYDTLTFSPLWRPQADWWRPKPPGDQRSRTVIVIDAATGHELMAMTLAEARLLVDLSRQHGDPPNLFVWQHSFYHQPESRPLTLEVDLTALTSTRSQPSDQSNPDEATTAWLAEQYDRLASTARG